MHNFFNRNDDMQASKIITQFRQLMAEGKREAAFDMLTDDAYWHVDEIGAPWSGVFHGKDQIIAHFSRIDGTTSGFSRKIDQLFEEGDTVIEIGSLDCVLVKTGEPFHTEYVSVYKTRNGQLAYYRIYEDSLKLHRAYFKENA
jgi:ketosteroid isomerase-like protein